MVSVICVGCGEPKKAMGWYHLTQLLDESRAKVISVVEPWYLGKGCGAAGADVFAKFREDANKSHPGIGFYSNVEELPELTQEAGVSTPVLALLAGRTENNPELFEAVCKKGVTHVLVEKPGAETAAQLEAMHELAGKNGIQVVVGYNKNVSEYTQEAIKEIESARASGGRLPVVTLEHNNAFEYGSEGLRTFMRGPGREGLVHNMACHELAIATTFLGLCRDRIVSLTIDPNLSEQITFDDGHKDWVRLSFSVVLTSDTNAYPTELRFVVNRCGGNFSCLQLGEDEECQTFTLPSEAHASWVKKAQEMDPEIRPYFLLQSPDYRKLKGDILEHMAANKPGTPAGLCDISAAVEVLHLADMLKPLLQDIWDAGSPWTWVPEGTRKVRKVSDS
jgi:predicted dehydrogenase